MDMSLRTQLARSALLLAGTRCSCEFAIALREPREAQERTLREIFKQTGQTALGAVHRWGDAGLITLKEKPLFYERTSGSSSRAKEIPYTRALLRSFEKMFLLWSCDVLRHAPVKFSTGRIFMSISLPTDSSEIADDSGYLSWPTRRILAPFFAVDPFADSLSEKPRETSEFFNDLARKLVAARDLEIISIWSPVYFLSLWRQILIHRLEWARTAPAWLRERLSTAAPVPSDFWPRLKMISCWTDGASRPAAHELQGLFPETWLQPKGLLATEGAMTLPWIAAGGSLPFLTGIYIEGLDSKSELVPLADFQEGESYELVITTFGGLSRYAIGDRVRVSGRFERTPCLEFIGRTGAVCDLVGEKIDDGLVRETFMRLGIPRAMLLPKKEFQYVCLTDTWLDPAVIDAELAKIHHYAVARDLGQLKPLEVRIVRNAHELALDFHETRGRKRGDVKECSLWTDLDMAENFLAAVSSNRADQNARHVIDTQRLEQPAR